MRTYIAFLRGINVSGKNLIKMNELALLFEKLGYQKVRTYIQSGNVVFESIDNEIDTIQEKLFYQILLMFGFEVPVIVRSGDDLNKVFKNNPFIHQGNEYIEKLHVTFLSEVPNQENTLKLDAFRNLEDHFVLEGDVVYIYCENGYGKTKLNNAFFENKLKISATTRNWKTVGKLVGLSSGG
jgi:uncharacterized protein (DUF1697 family)